MLFHMLGSTPEKRGSEGEEAKAASELTFSALGVPATMASCSGVTASVSFPVCSSDSALGDIY